MCYNLDASGFMESESDAPVSIQFPNGERTSSRFPLRWLPTELAASNRGFFYDQKSARCIPHGFFVV